jgi:transcriptional regulator with XRE-family HTH domain
LFFKLIVLYYFAQRYSINVLNNRNVLKIFMNTIGKRLKQFRESKGITQGEMAEKAGAGVSQGNITQWEKDRNKPSGDKLMKLLKAFPDLDSEWLMNGEKKGGKPGQNVALKKDIERLEKENIELKKKLNEANNRITDMSKEMNDIQKELIKVLLNQKK